MLPSDRSGGRIAGFRFLPTRNRFAPWVGPLVSALSFWGAIALPVCYLTLLVVGIDDRSELFLFLGLFALHVLTLIAGRSYRADSSL